MKTKICFPKTMACLCCLLILFIYNSKVSAQIIYTDIPDATPNATYPLDLNNDAIVDFVIHFGSLAGGPIGVICSPGNNNAYSGDFIGGLHLSWALSSSNNICDSLATWYDSSNPGVMGLGASTGYWLGATDKYLALKLIVGSNTYYGWARLDLLFISGSFTIKDYAYNSTPNACIQAGQTTLRINENKPKKSISIFPNPFISSTNIRTNDILKNATLTIYNAFGQLVKQVKNISGQSFTLSRDNLPSGLYSIRLTEENKTIAVEKLIIAN
jgi:Secretion system C-terminal sorting domain